MLYTVKIGENEEALLFSFEDPVEMDTFLKLYLKSRNEILDKVAKSKFNGTQFKIIMVIWRYTYGFGRKDHEFSLSFLSEATETDKRQLKRELENLIEKKVLLVVKEATFTTSRILSFNKLFTDSGEDNQEVVISPTPQGVKQHTPQGVNSPTKKENIKEKYKENIYAFWNDQKIVIHKSMTDKIKTAIDKAMKNKSTEEEIKIAIENYSKILKDPQYYFNYKWSLEDFLNRGLTKFLDWEVCSNNFINSSIKNEKKVVGFTQEPICIPNVGARKEYRGGNY